MRSFRVGVVHVYVDEKGVGIDENTGGSAFTSVGAGCTLQEFAEGGLHDAIPSAIFPAVVEEVSRLLGRPVVIAPAPLAGPLEPAPLPGPLAKDSADWPALVRAVATDTLPKLWNEELVTSVAALTHASAHSEWAKELLVRMLAATRDADVFGACVDGLIPHGVSRPDLWVALGASEAPRLEEARQLLEEPPLLPYWIGANPTCARCGGEPCSLVFCHDALRYRPCGDSCRDATCEVRCSRCGAFSVHVRHDES